MRVRSGPLASSMLVVAFEDEDEDEGRGRNAKLFANSRATLCSARVQRGSTGVGTESEPAPGSLLLRGMDRPEGIVLEPTRSEPEKPRSREAGLVQRT